MTQHSSLQLFENKKVRTLWDDTQEKWYFSIVDVIQILTESTIPKRYWSDLKKKLSKEGARGPFSKNTKPSSSKDGFSLKSNS